MARAILILCALLALAPAQACHLHHSGMARLAHESALAADSACAARSAWRLKCDLARVKARRAADSACPLSLILGDVAWLERAHADLNSIRALTAAATRSEKRWGPMPGETSIQRWLAGTPRYPRTNLFDGGWGGAATPVVCGVALITSNAANHESVALKQDACYAAGLATTVAVTAVTKHFIKRERPLAAIYPEVDHYDRKTNPRFNSESFFSGHTSSAVFGARFLAITLRDQNRYRAAPYVLYSWAALVGYSRVHAYRHYLSDVVVGAVVGWLLADAFHALAKE